MINTKKVLGVMGSPYKKGNICILVSNILEAAKNSGASTEMILLGDRLMNQ